MLLYTLTLVVPTKPFRTNTSSRHACYTSHHALSISTFLLYPWVCCCFGLVFVGFFAALCSLYHQPISIFTLDDFKSYFLPKPFSNNFPSILNKLPSIALPLTDIYYTQSIWDKNITLPTEFCQPEETKEQVSLLHSRASSFS